VTAQEFLFVSVGASSVIASLSFAALVVGLATRRRSHEVRRSVAGPPPHGEDDPLVSRMRELQNTRFAPRVFDGRRRKEGA